ncbi:LamG-like jellyroll fold domain-containing protein [Acinetobacter johnsonii]|uniref:LamG-like jellyroll fold domain-containing protein n=1 Tax=Acinetobacter johnsonii TaxID=40214 RepID=UPI002448FDFF|nr:LamG-like jellyroll fold domain-containing protein [Acinetobacter johnsonii]MDH1706238.1 LamG domain-containing protein [Acinetobacter johnsonii]
MAGVRLEFAQFGHFDYFNIYRNNFATAVGNLGEPIGTSSTMYYADLTTEPNNDYYYRIGVIRDLIEEFSEEIHVRTEVVFDPPYNLTVEFKNDEANRLELNWSLDGFVDEQRYYCSETPIDPLNLPMPKAVFAGDVRTYTDTNIVAGLAYYACVGSVKNGVEKISDEVRVVCDDIYQKTSCLLIADSPIIADLSKHNRALTVRGNVQYVDASINTPLFSSGSYYFDGSGDAIDINIDALGVSDFTIELMARFLTPNSGKSWHRYFDYGRAPNIHEFSISNNSSDNPQYPIMYGLSASNAWSLLISKNKSFSFASYAHICLMRKSGVLYIFVNGVLSNSTNAVISKVYTGTIIRIGADLGSATATASESKMYLDSFRVVTDALYNTAGFTPPASKFIY